MKILVCIKQVADLESRFVVPAGATWFDEADLSFRINEYDEYAIEEAVRLKESLPESELVVLTLGPPRAAEALKKALAMGADRAIHLNDPKAQDRDSFSVAQAIAGAVKDQGFDLIFTGMQSQDRGSGQVGLLLSELLGINGVSCVVGFAKTEGGIQVERELDGGLRAEVALGLPALVTCQLGLNQPRYPTLPNIMKAKKKPLETIELGPQTAPRVKAQGLSLPPKRGAAEFIEGDNATKVAKLVAILKEKKLVG
ncbi:MAG: electron transfer flavoprotein subunit beta [Candidatus Lambdaproteobacteria bacterium RIFOXYD1_FULL_56_27]|uniref:Electron transfer flavoprotein subunit beta n=1 Tax=Candidatus Lambdaproteobacteria bacterium RIFOXYD2_FULL_56_26 TaxID=1817773 RepID=A0A1F6GZM7_9PROT|nr:MAG: electron transfer flavoprotein subunit beta [Candidatus Lambdaproteobacteria bacterium RIFOXYC1_FULL_56_13]OGH03605.1 MAG: electron transfer flavoprotein subunit beta [Candidatus Lambdaproteobacteria bacterium RIFOXYD2_FULL_56_26]OGH06791.1 MAG: electron transfer flavoprotein subunit beta [Candidatus Lambdaproteobacteria bacterium RIFOXYD1_FULL_56_27]